MYKRQRIKKLGRKKTHRESLVNNQLKTLFEFGYIRTTSAKAKVLRTNAEALINKSDDSLQFRRNIEKVFGKKSLVKKYMEYISNDDKGVRVIKVGFRPGDMTEMSKLELLGFKKAKRKEDKVETKSKKEEKPKKEEVKEDKKNIIEEIAKRRTPKVSTKKVDAMPKKERAKSRSGL